MAETLEEIKEKRRGEEGGGPRRVFVEVGTHGIPAPFLGERGKEEGLYIGIDVSGEDLKEGKNRAEFRRKMDGGRERALFVAADARALPLADESADELYFGNVFGDPSISENVKDKFSSEAARALKSEGRMVVKEDNTPMEFEKLEALLAKHGFSPEKKIVPDDTEWRATVMPYSAVSAKRPEKEESALYGRDPYFRNNSYLAVFKRRQQQTK